MHSRNFPYLQLLQRRRCVCGCGADDVDVTFAGRFGGVTDTVVVSVIMHM